MNILSLEASGTHVALMALQHEESAKNAANLSVRVAWSSDETRSLSRELASKIAAVLESAQWKLGDVDAFAVGLGPGSWTSLRVVLATAKTLAQARNWKLCGVPTFDAIARAAHFALLHNPAPTGQSNANSAISSTRNADLSSAQLDSLLDENRETPILSEGEIANFVANSVIIVASPSRAGEIYSKVFRVQNEIWTILQDEKVGSVAELVAQTNKFSSPETPILMAGDARLEVRDALQNVETSRKIWSAQVTIEEIALHIARLAWARLERNDSDDALLLQPLYVAPSAAERKLESDKKSP